jgi:hypothetical protein
MTEKRQLWMRAYYFSFSPTGVELVDRILSAIAHAGKGYHHTSDWTEPTEPEGPFRGTSYVDWIQHAAEDAAAEIRRLEAAAVGRAGSLPHDAGDDPCIHQRLGVQ